MARGYFDRWRVRKPYRNYVTPELVELILKSPPPAPRTMQTEFVLALVRDNELERVPERVGRIYNLARQAGGFVESSGGALVLITFWMLAMRHDQPASQDKGRRACLASISREMSADMAILHGESRLLMANCGEQCSFHAMVLEGLTGMLGTLTAEMRFGEIREWTGPSNSPHGESARPPRAKHDSA